MRQARLEPMFKWRMDSQAAGSTRKLRLLLISTRSVFYSLYINYSLSIFSVLILKKSVSLKIVSSNQVEDDYAPLQNSGSVAQEPAVPDETAADNGELQVSHFYSFLSIFSIFQAFESIYLEDIDHHFLFLGSRLWQRE
jgi:hypothetical protein